MLNQNQRKKNLLAGLFLVVLFCFFSAASAQDDRIQYPGALRNSYFGVNIGSINYPFSSAQLKDGNTVGSVKVPHTAVRIILFGHQFNKNLSAQISYMRPVKWVEYRNVNNTNETHTVWMNVAGLTLLSDFYIGKKISLATEGGLGLIMRKGFEINNTQVVSNASYATCLLGGSLKYHLNKKWDLQLSGVWSPKNAKEKQPQTTFFAAGFNYYMRPLSQQRVEKVKAAGYYFPKQIIAAGYATNGLGYGVNKAVSKGPIPIFWGGEVKVKRGFHLSYQRNIFHSKKVFALDWGGGLAFWQSSRNTTNFFTISAYPVFRFTVLRSKSLDGYLEYCVAGPTYISKTHVDGKRTGEKFTFYDMMGMGFLTGKNKNINAGIRIAHFSNGNLFPYNDGFMIPLTFSLGYVLN